MNYLVIQRPTVIYLPKRAGAFGKAVFAWPPGTEPKEQTFTVIEWLDFNRLKIDRAHASYALIECPERVLLPINV